MSFLVHLGIGLLFGLGLVVSGMSDPAKVLNFLDLARIRSGGWDPALAFVLAGAVGTTAVGYRLVLAQGRPLLDTRFHLPVPRTIDGRLVAGAALFGIGWGLAGLCPGPALTLLGLPDPLSDGSAAFFVAAMALGMAGARAIGEAPPQA
jgi:uncharacterized protein